MSNHEWDDDPITLRYLWMKQKDLSDKFERDAGIVSDDYASFYRLRLFDLKQKFVTPIPFELIQAKTNYEHAFKDCGGVYDYPNGGYNIDGWKIRTDVVSVR